MLEIALWLILTTLTCPNFSLGDLALPEISSDGADRARNRSLTALTCPKSHFEGSDGHRQAPTLDFATICNDLQRFATTCNSPVANRCKPLHHYLLHGGCKPLHHYLLHGGCEQTAREQVESNSASASSSDKKECEPDFSLLDQVLRNQVSGPKLLGRNAHGHAQRVRIHDARRCSVHA